MQAWKIVHLYRRGLNIRQVANFSSGPNRVQKKALGRSTPGCFGLNGLHKACDWEHISKNCVTDCLKLAGRIREENKNPSIEVLQLFDDLSDRLCNILDVAQLCRNVHPDAQFVQGADETLRHVLSVIQYLNCDETMYKPLNALYEQHEDGKGKGTFNMLSREQLIMVKSLKRDFERGGIHLKRHDKERLITLQEQVTKAGNDFMDGPTDEPPSIDIPVHKMGQLPRSFRSRLLPSENSPNKLKVPLYSSNSQLLLKWIPDSRIREKVFRSSHDYFGRKKLGVLDSVLTTRHSIANLLGHSTYSSLVFDDRLASSPGDVLHFLQKLAKLVHTGAIQDKNALEVEKLRMEQNLAKNGRTHVHGWDRSFYIGRLKAQNFDISSSEISQYFSLAACLKGLADIVQSIFDVSLKVVNPAPGELWHADVNKLQLSDKHGKLLGHIFLDLYPREGKYDHAAHFTITCGRQPREESSEYQTPVVVLICNFRRSDTSGTRLLTITEYETLFHEFGHSLHSLLSRTKYQHLSGTRVTTDFVEVPSHLWEHFAWDSRVLSRIAKHHRTGDPMPAKMIRSLCASRKGFISTDTQMQILFSAMDLEFHGLNPPIGTTTKAFENLQSKLTAYAPDEGIPIPATFHHFVEYGAGYYSYMFARVLSAQLWSVLFQKDPFSKEGGSKLRHGLLAHGGAADPATLITNILGNDINCDAFLRNSDMNGSCEKNSLPLPISRKLE